MNIEWNKVTWYSKLGTVIAAVITVFLGVYFWNEYQEIQSLNDINFTENSQGKSKIIQNKPIMQEQLDGDLYEIRLTLAPGVSEEEVKDALPHYSTPNFPWSSPWHPWSTGNYLAYLLGFGELDPVEPDLFKDSISLIAYDVSEGNLFGLFNKESTMFNRSYYILAAPGAKEATMGEVYNQEGVLAVASKADPKLLPFIKNQSYCENDSDCTVGRNICSYGAHNKFRKYIADVLGCEGPSYTQENLQELFQICDPYTHHPVIEYSGASCINNICVAQGRTLTCEEGGLP